MAYRPPAGGGPSPTVEQLSLAVQRIRATPPRLISSPPTQPRRAAVSLVLRVRPGGDSADLPAPEDVPNTLEEFFDLEWVNHPDSRAELLYIRRDKASTTSENGAIGGPTAGAGAGGIGSKSLGLAGSVRSSLSGNVASGSGAPAHVAFPGGRTEESDEGALYTAMRQTWEEIGLDLAEREFTCIGQLDDREITTSLGKRLLMILSPFVFLHLSPYDPPIEPPEEDTDTTLHWVPISALLSPNPTWSYVTVDISSRLAPRHNILRTAVRLLVGNMKFRALVLSSEDLLDDVDSLVGRQRRLLLASSTSSGYGLVDPVTGGPLSSPPEELRLWGLTLGMTLDLIAFMYPRIDDLPPGDPSSDEFDEIGGVQMMPSMASVFPRFSVPDVNFWIWVFGRRYRAVLKAWEASVIRSRMSRNSSHLATDRRINWSGQALSTFYAAVRKALLVVIVGRAVGILLTIAVGVVYLMKKIGTGWDDWDLDLDFEVD